MQQIDVIYLVLFIVCFFAGILAGLLLAEVPQLTDVRQEHSKGENNE